MARAFDSMTISNALKVVNSQHTNVKKGWKIENTKLNVCVLYYYLLYSGGIHSNENI